ncbi:MAG TPA: hypothetical protein VE825_00420 [Terriglobales bacterium]|jgi:hypothetical protein|nr:hypothetical protein [Terriglobales bacterium]
MRTIRKKALILGLVVLVAGVLAAGQSAPANKGKIQKSGTVEAGVEAGCLVLRDTRDHKLYNVLFVTGKKPEAGQEISFTGNLSDNMTTCMEGIEVVVTSWKPLKAGTTKTRGNSVQ